MTCKHTYISLLDQAKSKRNTPVFHKFGQKRKLHGLFNGLEQLMQYSADGLNEIKNKSDYIFSNFFCGIHQTFTVGFKTNVKLQPSGAHPLRLDLCARVRLSMGTRT